ncbi:MAG TPA: succinate dehydrogenase, hydrophobic membrane anchor protein [Caulobacteraceae bacterium]|nr:succinate dehydrogenase, hydrophobic membrane anchor protein [Caulobacteraceae bacterium]
MSAGRYRTDLSRARGLGASKTGPATWLSERITSILLVPLSVWAVFAGFRLASVDYAAAVGWLQRPFNAAMLTLLVVVSFLHMHAGMRVIVEDYIHKTLNKSVILVTNLMVCLFAAAIAVISILKVALGGGIF